MILDNADSGGAADLPEIANSLRFDGTNDYLTRTPSVAGNQTKWTASFWMKRSKLAAIQHFFEAGGTVGQTYMTTADKMTIALGASPLIWTTTQLFRDVSSWYHLVITWDSNNATAGDRFQLYVGGTRVMAFDTTGSVTSGASSTINAASVHNIGCYNGSVVELSDFYVASFCFIDGSALTPADFAYTDPNGQWRSLSKAALASLASAGGTNSFFLPFDNGSSTTTLGYDASSKGNNWTLTNMVRDGSVNDCWSYDTPTNNFATLNPLRSGTVPSNGALTHGTGTQYLMDATYLMASGKWYWEVVYSAPVSVYPICGIHSGADFAVAKYTGQDSNGYGLCSDGNIYYNAASVALYSSVGTNGVAMFAYDAATGKFWAGANGTWFNSGNPVAGTGQVATAAWYASGSYPSVTAYSSSKAYANFGQRPVSGGVDDRAASGGYFRYTPPSGFKALCTKNLSATGSVITSGTFTGNAAADGPYVWLNGTPTTMTIDGNAVTWGTHADKLANGFKIRTASGPYNDAASNSYTVTVNDGIFKFNNAEKNP